MKIKQNRVKKLSFVFALLVAFSSIGGTIFAPQASALTKKEWEACKKEYQGISLANGSTSAQKKKYAKFKASKCYVDKGGNCSQLSKGSGSFAYVQADCPISDKYIKQAAEQKKKAEEEKKKAEAAKNGAPTSLAQGNDCGGVDTAIIKCSATNSGDVTDNGIWALLLLVINILTTGVAVLGVAGIVYGSILYTTAEDKADQVKKATDVITNVVIGLIAFALMWSVLNFIIPGGVFKP